jgi:undecaprenyl-diphosphatase
VNVPPDGKPQVTRPRVGRAVPAVVATVIFCAAVLGVLGLGVRTGFTPELRVDAAVSEALYAGDHRATALNVLLQVLTAPGLTVVRVAVFLPVLVLLLLRRAWWTALWVAVTILGIGPLTTVLKEFFGRVRPPFAQGGARLETLSYPSGHSSGIATLVTVGLVLAWPLLSPRARRWWVLAGVALVLLVGLTRIWLGVHYPSDVLGGWALGISWTLFTALVFGALPGGRAALRRTG